MKYSGAEIIIKLLELQGIEVIAGIPGGANLPLYDALYQSSIRHILARHEQGAGFIAQGMARTTGKPAVCFATSGPGATNLLTAIADAKLDSIPVIAITGQVSTGLIGTDAFQEIDTYGMTIPITKHNFLVREARELLHVIPEAFSIASSGRPGPVVIDVPKDVQLEKIEVEEWPAVTTTATSTMIEPEKIEQIARAINAAERPVLFIGGGIIHSGASEAVAELARKNSLPVTASLMGLGGFPPDDPMYLGMIGMHAARYTNYILKEADLILALGVRFDDRAIGNLSTFCPQAQVIHIDIDRAEINKLKPANLSLTCDIKEALTRITPQINADQRAGWMNRIRELQASAPFVLPQENDHRHPVTLIRAVSSLAPEDTIIVTDVGQHQMWVAQTYPFRQPRTLLTSGGLGTMGFGLPTALGAALACPDKRIVCISGDGSILMNIQELATLAELNLNVTVLIMNNGYLGLVRQQQEMFYNENYIACKFPGRHDFAAIGKAFGIPGYTLDGDGPPFALLEKALREPGPALIDAYVRETENVLPIVPPGAANHEMIGG